MISTFLGACKDPTPNPRESICNYLHSEIEHLKEQDFLTFRNETVKLLSEIQYKAEECKRQVTTIQQVTTFQLPEATQATAGCEYTLTILDTQPVTIPVLQPTQIATTQPATVVSKVQQPSRPSLASADVQFESIKDCQPTFSCSSTSGGKSAQHFWVIQSLWRDSQCTAVPADRHTTTISTLSTSTSTITSAILHSSRTVKTTQRVQPAKSTQMSRLAWSSHTNWQF